MKTSPSSATLSLEEIAHSKLHHSGNRFKNPFCKKRHGNLWRLLYWKLHIHNPYRKFYRYEKVVPVNINWGPSLSNGQVKITFIKHACFLINAQGTKFIVDPLFFGLFPGIKDFTPITSGLETMPKPNYILISHGHYDHLDRRSLRILKSTTPLVTPLGYKSLLRKWGFKYITELDWYEYLETDDAKIWLLPSNHWTIRNPLLGPNRSLWGSFLVETSAGYNIYISGDTAYFPGFKEIGQKFRIDLAIFCLGAYEPRWFMAQSHLNPSELIQAFKDLRAKKLMIGHWGSFRLGDEPVYFPPKEIESQMKKLDLHDKFVSLPHGKTASFAGQH